MQFDARYKAGTVCLRTSLKKLVGALLNHEAKTAVRSRARTREDLIKFETAVEALACNLILLAATFSDVGLAVPRSHSVIWGNAGASPVYGQHFLTAIDLMASLGLIHEGKRGYRISESVKQPSLIWPEKALAELLPLQPPDWRSVEVADSKIPIVLRDRKVNGQAAVLRFDESKEIKKYIRQMRRINAFIRASDIEIIGQNDSLMLDREGHIVAPNRRSLYRVFNNGCWKHGGRLAGGFWLSMRRVDRHRIRIDGEEITVPDYRQLFPRLAYVKAGMGDADCSTDLYDTAGDKSSREGWKKLLNAMLFSAKPLKAWPKATQKMFPDGTTLGQARALLLKRHAPIADLFGIGIGFELMWRESEMLIEVISKLADMGVTALPLHDAVIVAQSKAAIAADIMQTVFTQRTKSQCAIVSI
jgi:hypothetical protein